MELRERGSNCEIGSVLQTETYICRPPSVVKGRLLLICVAGVHLFFTANIVFGWATLVDVLRENGVFDDLCSDVNCAPRAVAFAVVVSCGAMGNAMSYLPLGIVLDRYGPRVCCIIAVSAQLLGALLVLCVRSMGNWALYGGFFFMGFGGPGVQVATFHVSEIFPAYASWTLVIFVFLGNAGVTLFCLLNIAVKGGWSLQLCWAFYTVAVVLILVSGALLWPKRAFVINNHDFPIEVQVQRAISSMSFRNQLLSPRFLYFCAFVAVNTMRISFNMLTFPYQVRYLELTAREEEFLTRAEMFEIPLGFVGVLIIAPLLDRWPIRRTYTLVNTVGLASSILLMVPVWPCVAVSVCLLAVSRQMTYSVFFSQLLRMAGENFGKLTGVAMLFCTAMCMLQYGLAALTESSFLDGAGYWTYLPSNIMVCALSFALYA